MLRVIDSLTALAIRTYDKCCKNSKILMTSFASGGLVSLVWCPVDKRISELCPNKHPIISYVYSYCDCYQYC